MQMYFDTEKFDIKSVEKLTRIINTDMVQHRNAREIGSEWMSYTVINYHESHQHILGESLYEQIA
jgi:hypothetical protein